jgi:hypothetical protein
VAEVYYVRASYAGKQPLDALLTAAIAVNQYLHRPLAGGTFSELRKSFPKSDEEFRVPYGAITRMQYPTSTKDTGRIGIAVNARMVRISLYDTLNPPAELSEVIEGVRNAMGAQFTLLEDEPAGEETVLRASAAVLRRRRPRWRGR